jgi:hypothetical protein
MEEGRSGDQWKTAREVWDAGRSEIVRTAAVVAAAEEEERRVMGDNADTARGGDGEGDALPGFRNSGPCHRR